MWQQWGMRQRKIRVRRYRDRNRPHWTFVVNYREAGKRKRKFFETEPQAKSFATFKNAELRRNGIFHAEFPERPRIMAQNAVEQLRPFGKTIEEAVAHFVAHLKAFSDADSAAKRAAEASAVSNFFPSRARLS